VHVSVIGWWRGCAKVKIFKVTNHALCARCGDDAIEEEFCSDDISSFGADVSKVFDPIAAHSPLDMVWVGFSGRCAQMMRRYVACLPFGIAENGIKNMVLVLGMVSVPWAKWWIFIALAARQKVPLELLLSSLYSASSPVSRLKAFLWSAMNCAHGSGEVV